MKVKIQEAGKWGSFKVMDDDGKSMFLTPSSKLDIGIEVGRTYEVTLFKPNGRKTTYITKATLITGRSQTQPSTSKTVEKKATGAPESTKSDKPSQEYWDKREAKKAQDIEYSVYLNNLTQFLCSRSESSEDDVLEFNKLLEVGVTDWFVAEQDLGIIPAPKTQNEKIVDDVIKEAQDNNNTCIDNDPYFGL